MAIDANWSSVKLLLPMTSDYQDVKAHSVSSVGGAALASTVGTPFGAGNALFLDGTDDHLAITDSADFTLGSSDFTIEVWIRFVSHSSTCAIISHRAGGSSNHAFSLEYSVGAAGLRFSYTTDGTTKVDIDRSWSPSDSVWYHVSVTRTTTIVKIKVDGSQIGADYTIGASSIYNSSAQIKIGAIDTTPIAFFSGYIGPVRLTTAARTITASPSEPFPRPTISGTVYDDVGAKAAKAVYVRDRDTGLVVGGALSDATTGEYAFYPNDFGEHEVARYDDVSDPTTNETVFNLVARSEPLGACTLKPIIDTQGHELTVKYDARSDSTQTPYAGTASVYFDGSSDCLQSTNIDFALGLNDFSIEFWYRPINGGHGGSWARVLQIGQNSTNGTLYLACSSSDNPSYLRCEFYSGSWQLVVQTTGTVSNNAWHFVQLRRVNGDFFMYLDGVLQGSKTGVSYNITATQLSIGANTVYGESFYGNVGPLRISRGPVRASTVVPAATALKPLVDGGSGENALIYDRVIPG